MYRIFPLSTELIAAIIILLPIMFLYHTVVFHNVRKTLVYGIFTLYLAEICVLVGFPNIIGIRIVLSFNIVPFLGILSDFRNSYLNILLFVPLGIFLPCLWQKYRTMKKTILFGSATSLGIEVSQIFTMRATDVNDLMTNVAGTVIGYLIGRVIIKKIPWLDSLKTKEGELYLLCGTVIAVMFLIQPFILLQL